MHSNLVLSILVAISLATVNCAPINLAEGKKLASENTSKPVAIVRFEEDELAKEDMMFQAQEMYTGAE
jgi:hypothetical protein